MGALTSQLGRAKLRQLLAAVGSMPTTDTAPVPATPYDWRNPRYFSGDQCHRLTQVLGQVAARMAEIFARSGRGAFEVSLHTLAQHFAGDLDCCVGANHHSPRLEQDRRIAFASEKEPPCGFVSIAPPTALVWTTWLLGEAEGSRNTGRALSALEESLLSDLLGAVLDIFLASLRPHHHLRPVGPVSQGPPPLPFEPTEEVCRIVFEVKAAQAGDVGANHHSPVPEVTFVLPCRRLAALAGKQVTAPARVSPSELSGVPNAKEGVGGPSHTLMEHLKEVPVTITAVLASTTVTFQEVLDLAPGDILLFDKPIEEPAELILNGRAAFRGRPAHANGHKAVVIVASEREGVTQTPEGKVAR